MVTASSKYLTLSLMTDIEKKISDSTLLKFFTGHNIENHNSQLLYC